MPSLPSFSKAASAPPPSAPPKPTWDPKPVSVRPFPWLRPTIRIRLTLLYGGMFLMAGIVLLTIIYMLAANALSAGNQLPFKIVDAKELKIYSSTCPGLTSVVDVPQLNSEVGRCLLRQRADALDTLLQRSLMALMGLTVVAFAFGYAMAGRVLSPLGRITRTAQRVAGSDLHRRIELG
ncbi:two-component sensor histidine kinase, partial [Streptomyces sp. NPDC050636]